MECSPVPPPGLGRVHVVDQGSSYVRVSVRGGRSLGTTVTALAPDKIILAQKVTTVNLPLESPQPCSRALP